MRQGACRWCSRQRAKRRSVWRHPDGSRNGIAVVITKLAVWTNGAGLIFYIVVLVLSSLISNLPGWAYARRHEGASALSLWLGTPALVMWIGLLFSNIGHPSLGNLIEVADDGLGRSRLHAGTYHRQISQESSGDYGSTRDNSLHRRDHSPDHPWIS